MKEMIMAAGLDGAIGKDNGLLWELKDDMEHFKKLTMGRTVVMGRKTLDSLPNGPLKGRNNIVISRNTIGSFKIDETTTLTFMDIADFIVNEPDDYVVIGGQQIYELLKSSVDIIWLTLVFGVFPDADTFLPEIYPDQWVPHAAEFYPADHRNEYPFHIVKMTKR